MTKPPGWHEPPWPRRTTVSSAGLQQLLGENTEGERLPMPEYCNTDGTRRGNSATTKGLVTAPAGSAATRDDEALAVLAAERAAAAPGTRGQGLRRRWRGTARPDHLAVTDGQDVTAVVDITIPAVPVRAARSCG